MLFVTAFLVRTKNYHGGSFLAKESIVTTYLSAPAFCDQKRKNIEVHVMHDVILTRNYTRFGFAHFYMVNSNSNITSNEFRFLIFRNHIARMTHHQDIFLTDIADVTVLYPPPVQDQLIVSSDAQGSKHWLWTKGRLIGYAKEDAYMQSLRNGRAFVYNCGIIGGRLSVIWPFLEAIVNELVRFWSLRPVQDTCYGADMFFVNKLLFRSSVEPLTGHPRGPVNLPMWAVVPGCNTHECRHQFLRKTMGFYWFGHKIPVTWTSVFRQSFCKNNSSKK